MSQPEMNMHKASEKLGLEDELPFGKASPTWVPS